MEIAGVALATVLSSPLSRACARISPKTSGLLTSGEALAYRFFRVFADSEDRDPCKRSADSGSVSALTVNSIVNKFGSTVMAGYGAGLRLDQFAFMPAMSGGLAVTSLVG